MNDQRYWDAEQHADKDDKMDDETMKTNFCKNCDSNPVYDDGLCETCYGYRETVRAEIAERKNDDIAPTMFTVGMLHDISRTIAIERLRFGCDFEKSFVKNTTGNNVVNDDDLQHIRECSQGLIKLELDGHAYICVNQSRSM